MVPTEVLKKVRRIQILTAAMVNDFFAGQYHSAFKGRGMEFEEVREYQPGDDVRTIDWNVTARVGRPFVKHYREERELTVMLIVDISASQEFGTNEQTKAEFVAELGATLAFSAITNNDKVGLLLFTDRIERHVPAKKGISHVLRVVRELLYHEPAGRKTDVAVALRHLDHVLSRRSVVFLISDFQTPEFINALRIVRHRHDVIPVIVGDRAEIAFPRIGGLVRLYDAETGDEYDVDAASLAYLERSNGRARANRATLIQEFRKLRIDSIEIETGRSFVDPLRKFFRQRGARR